VTLGRLYQRLHDGPHGIRYHVTHGIRARSCD
jgi:hypothetical protein